MTRDINSDDVGKRVVTSEGTHVGEVSDVRNGNAHVRTSDDSDLTDKVKSMLGWDDSDDTHELRNEHVDRVDDEVRLRNH